MQACLGVKKVRESPFHHSGGALKLVQGCLSARKDRKSCFHHCGVLVKLVKACLCDRKDRDSRFHNCGGHVELAEARQKGRRKLFSPLRIFSDARSVLFRYQECSTKYFSPLCRSCQAMPACLTGSNGRESSFHH